MDLSTLAQVAAVTSSGVFAGFTWCLSYAVIPTIIHAPEALLARQWRDQYLHGFYISRPLCAIDGLSWGYLAYAAPPSSLARTLYVLAALSTASGVPYALTFLRRTNGALSIRAEKLAGPGNGAIALTYAFNEKRSIDRERTWSTKELVLRWKWHNEVRTAVLILGTMLGAWGMAL